MKAFSELTEREVLAVAISGEEEDSRIYELCGRSGRAIPGVCEDFRRNGRRREKPPAFVARDLRTALWSQFHERDHAVFRIEDSGPGIPEAELRRVLEPFYRGSWSTKEGTGLGLSIVRRIAETLGGSVLLENIGGRGSTGLRVSVRIPATDKSQGSSEEFRKAAS